jgi:hypothetical protein
MPVSEINKRPGVCYALSSDGIELPIVDVTHPAFALNVSEAEQQVLIKKFFKESQPLSRLPKPIRNLVLRYFLRGSVLADGIRRAQGSYMGGMPTYLLKLGPEMLGSAYAKPIDRRIAAALPVLAVRLRLQDIAYLMAEALAPALLSNPSRSLQFINIAGGPAIDSLNALIVLNKEHPGALGERPVSIEVLDLDDAGPAFGKAALAALSNEGAPLQGTPVVFRHVPYDWAKAADLVPLLSAAHAQGALVISSSEGGLFEYGSDTEIEANLTALRACAEVLAVVGSVTRADEPIRLLHQTSAAATRPRGLASFRVLVERTGWKVTRAVERPFSDHFVLN